MKLFICSPRGFCAGVKRAIKTVEHAILNFKKVYVYNHIVHNKHVVNKLKEKGAIFIDDIKKALKNSYIIYSAHGVSPFVRIESKKLGLIEIDATCPLVEKNHFLVKKYVKLGYKIILIGHKNHIEVIGTASEALKDTYVIESLKDIEKLSLSKNQKIFCLAQTTLNVDNVKKILNKLKEKYKNLETVKNSSICYATTNRQEALKNVLPFVDLAFIIGDPKSSNSNRLKEIALEKNIPSYLINCSLEISGKWLKNKKNIAITAGASTPENVVQDCIEKLKFFGVSTVEEAFFKEEKIIFDLPLIFKS